MQTGQFPQCSFLSRIQIEKKNWFAYQLHDLQKCVLTGSDLVKKCTDAPFFLPLRSCSTFPTFLSIAKIVTSYPKSSLLSAKSPKV